MLLIAYFGIFRKYQWQCLLLASYVFYVMVGGYLSSVFILLSTITVFLGARAIEGKESPKKKRILLTVLIFNLAILAVIKYGRFALGLVGLGGAVGIGDVVGVEGAVGTEGAVGDIFSKIGLPLGISFYTFQALGYLMDVYRGKAKAEDNPFKFALFVSFFPQILQGPISRFGELHEQLVDTHKFSFERLKLGAERMLWGYFKKLVIADRIAVMSNNIYSNYEVEGYAGLTIFIGVIFYGIQIYADFSGGMDIVIGLSEALGITLPENFRQPFWARSVSEFWQRWHVTLGTWMRDYVFYPLALSKPFARLGKKARNVFGNKTGKVIPTCIASFIVFTLVGIWHGSGWNYVIYGLYQAMFVATGTLFAGAYEKVDDALHISNDNKAWHIFQMMRTLVIITFGRYLSRAASVSDAVGMIKATFSSFNPHIIYDGTLLNLGISGKEMLVLIISIIIMFSADVIHEKGCRIRETLETKGLFLRWAIYLAGIFVVVIFGVYGYGFTSAGFIYQGF
ncbi:MAG: MBOAT family protein [Firmicutes bacterium]|nr:MBOAT family protein [Bacillota bacterium]